MTAIAPSTADREILVTREVDAPRHLVFQAMTHPEHIVHWWGPTGFSLTLHEMDVRPGGEWKFTMHGPDGRKYDNHNRFVEVVRPERVVLEHASEPRHLATWTFDDLGNGRTRVTMHMVFETAELREFTVRTFNAVEGAKQTMARLADYVPESLADREIVHEKVIPFPRARVYSAWTEARHLDAWWGPDGYPIKTRHLDLRPGGIWQFDMASPDGASFEERIAFHEVSAGERLVYTHGSEDDPDQFHTTVTFEEVAGGTRVTMRAIFRTAAERNHVVEEYHAIEAGQQTLAHLAEHVARM